MILPQLRAFRGYPPANRWPNSTLSTASRIEHLRRGLPTHFRDWHTAGNPFANPSRAIADAIRPALRQTSAF
jgi:hypothetical protein